jgi:hypothetical protein
MGYKVMILGKSYDLPARTLAVDDKIDEIGSLDRAYRAGEITRRESVEKMYEFVTTLAPDSVPSIDEVDTNDLLKICMDILTIYNLPAQRAKADAAIGELRAIISKPEFQKLLAIAETGKK